MAPRWGVGASALGEPSEVAGPGASVCETTISGVVKLFLGRLMTPSIVESHTGAVGCVPACQLVNP